MLVGDDGGGWVLKNDISWRLIYTKARPGSMSGRGARRSGVLRTSGAKLRHTFEGATYPDTDTIKAGGPSVSPRRPLLVTDDTSSRQNANTPAIFRRIDPSVDEAMFSRFFRLSPVEL